MRKRRLLFVLWRILKLREECSRLEGPVKGAQGLRKPFCDNSGIRWTVTDAWSKNKDDVSSEPFAAVIRRLVMVTVL